MLPLNIGSLSHARANDLKTAGGKTYLGPAGPAPMAEDRELVSNDGRVMIMRFMDPDVIKRYGTSIYVRCGA